MKKIEIRSGRSKIHFERNGDHILVEKEGKGDIVLSDVSIQLLINFLSGKV